MAPRFNIRTQARDPEDGAFLSACFDASLPELAARGSGAQWGSEPWTERPGSDAVLRSWMPPSDWDAAKGEPPLRMFVAEAPLPDGEKDGAPPAAVEYRTDDATGVCYRPVAIAVVKNDAWSDYVEPRAEFAPVIAAAREQGQWLYIDALISDFRAGPIRKGAGAALVAAVRDYAASRGAKTVFVDCWAGNNGVLKRYYESLGFVVVGDFLLDRPTKDPWPTSLLRLDL